MSRDGFRPQLHPEPFVFVTVEHPPAEAIATFRESEEMTAILPKETADGRGLSYTYVAAWITITVHSALDAVGFLAPVMAKLADAGISCNVVSAVHHDHLFVPWEKRDETMAILRQR